MEKNKSTYSIREVLDLYLSKHKHMEYRIKSQEALMIWKTVVDNYIKLHTKAILIKDNVLFVNTDSTVLANELSLRGNELVGKLNTALRLPLIEKIIFRSGYVGSKKKNKDKKDNINNKLNVKTLNMIDKAANNIKEDELRDIMKKFLTTSAIHSKSK